MKEMVTSIIVTREKKLRNLTKNTVLPFTSTDTVLNLFSSKLTDEKVISLRFEPQYSNEANSVSKTDIFSTFKFIHCAMSKDLTDKKMQEN